MKNGVTLKIMIEIVSLKKRVEVVLLNFLKKH